MKKFYKLSIVALAGLFFSVNSIATETLTWKIRGLSATEWSEPKTLTSEGEESQIIVSFNRYTFENATNIWVEGTQYPTFDYIKLSDATNESTGGNIENQINYSSYIQIEIPAGKAPVTKVELVGYAFGAADEMDLCAITEAYSTTDNSVNAFKLANPTSLYEPWGTELYFLGTPMDYVSNGYSNTYTVGRDEYGEGVNKPIPCNNIDELKDIRYIRYNWSSAEFGNITSIGRGRPLALFGLNIYTDPGSLVSIGQEKEDQKITLSFAAEQVNFSETADVQIFNVQGQVVKSERGVSQISTSELEKGIYILKAVSTEKQNNAITAKFIR